MNNNQFLEVITKSFIRCMETGPRSNAKLMILHGAIAQDLQDRLTPEYSVSSLGKGDGKEKKIIGRYYPKMIDIAVTKNDIPIAGIAVKFVMSNYSQNSNNYFEGMLGETANIRSNGVAYFQIIILPEELPYYKEGGIIASWERITENNIHKYTVLSNDNSDIYTHTPNKTLLYLVNLPETDKSVVGTREEHSNYHVTSKNGSSATPSGGKWPSFGDGVILNDYEMFLDKIYHYIKSV